MASCSKARSTPACNSIPWVYVGEDAASTISAPANDTVGEWQFTTYNVNGDWRRPIPAKAEGFLRRAVARHRLDLRNRAMSRRSRRAR